MSVKRIFGMLPLALLVIFALLTCALAEGTEGTETATDAQTEAEALAEEALAEEALAEEALAEEALAEEALAEAAETEEADTEAEAENKPTLRFDRESLNIAVGKSYTLKPHVDGAKPGKYPAYVWETSSPDVATVNGAGFVKAVTDGHVVITCSLTLADGTLLSCSCPVYCYVPVTSVSCGETNISLCVKQQYRMKVQAMPHTATDKSMDYTSSNPAVCTVDENGVLTGVSAGKCTISYTARYGRATGRVKVEVPSFGLPQPELTIVTPTPVKWTVDCFGTEFEKLTALSKQKDIAECALEDGRLVLTPVGVGKTEVVLTDAKTRSKFTLKVTVAPGAITPQEQVRVTSVTYNGKYIKILCRNRTGKALTSITWRVRFLDAAGQDYGHTDLANYARGKEITEFTDSFPKKKLATGNTRTISFRMPDFGYDGATACMAALSGYTTEEGDTVRFTENQLCWISSLGGNTPGEKSAALTPLTAQDAELAAQNPIGWKTRLLTPEHASRLGVPSCGLLLYGFYANNNAEKNGFKMYDVLLDVNGRSFAEDPYLPDRVQLWYQNHETLTFTVYRGGETLTLQLK